MFPNNLSLRHKFSNKVPDVVHAVNNDFKSDKICCGFVESEDGSYFAVHSPFGLCGKGKQKNPESFFSLIALKVLEKT